MVLYLIFITPFFNFWRPLFKELRSTPQPIYFHGDELATIYSISTNTSNRYIKYILIVTTSPLWNFLKELIFSHLSPRLWPRHEKRFISLSSPQSFMSWRIDWRRFWGFWSEDRYHHHESPPSSVFSPSVVVQAGRKVVMKSRTQMITHLEFLGFTSGNGHPWIVVLSPLEDFSTRFRLPPPNSVNQPNDTVEHYRLLLFLYGWF